MNRRGFLGLFPAAGASIALPGCLASPGPATAAADRRVMTVRGPVAARELGLTLSHEHALANFQSFEEWHRAPHPYRREEVIAKVLPHLVRIREMGCRTFIDATAVGLGRDALLLRELSEASGLHIVTVTGNYAAFDYKFLPPYAYHDTTRQLADRWIREWNEGIDGTGVRPGFIKLSVNGGTLSEVERKLIQAGALAHRATGLAIGVHTGPARAAYEQLDLLEAAGVPASAWIWIHAQGEADPAQYLAAARRGAWISLDGVSADSLEVHRDRVVALRDAGLLHRVLVSQDAGWYSVGEPDGGTLRPYDLVFTRFIPGLRERGFTDADIGRLFENNPADAFGIAPV
jgi:phosphotriesterase-related protein